MECEIRYQRKNRCQKQEPAQGPGESRGKDLSAVTAVEFGPGGEFRFVFGGSSDLAIPPGAATVQVGADLRGADGAHLQSIAQIF